MHIHRNIHVDVNRIINEFDATRDKRIALLFNNHDYNESSVDD